MEDGQKIYIPSKSENKEKTSNIVSENSGEGIIKDESNKTTNLININKAGAIELQELPGIGSSTAEKIIEYRNQNGNFKSIEDIKNVSGIGEAKFNNIK